MANVEPFRPLPFVGALHASLQAENLALAAARSDEAARQPQIWRPTRELLQLRGQVQRAVAWTMGAWPLRACDAILGTTARPQQLAAAHDVQVRRGHRPCPADDSFGLPGAMGMAAVAAGAALVAAVASPLGQGPRARAAVDAVGRLNLGLACAAVAAATLIVKLGLAAVAVALGLAVGACRIVVEGALGGPAVLPLARAHPPVAAAWRWQAQDNLGCLEVPGSAERRSRLAVGRQAVDRLVAGGSWPITAVHGYALAAARAPALATANSAIATDATAAATTAAVATGAAANAATALPATPAALPAATTPLQQWEQHVRLLSAPETTLRLLQGCTVELAGSRLDVAALLSSTPTARASTQLRLLRLPGAPPAMQVDTLLSWPKGYRVQAGDAPPVALAEGLALALTVEVEAPLAAATATPVARVRQAELYVGQSAMDRLVAAPTA